MAPRLRNAARPALLTLLLGAAALGACGGGGAGEGAAPTASTSATGVPRLTAGPVTVQRTGAAGSAEPSVVDALVAAAGSYVRAASLDPLEGRPVRLDALATEVARPLTRGPDGATLTDAGYGRLDELRVDARPVPVTVLTDAQGTAVLGTVTLDLTLTGRNDRGPVRIHRTGELAFVREGDAWRLDSWRLAVTRDGRGVPAAPHTPTSTEAP